MIRMKYVIFKHESGGLVHPVVFPESTTHSQVSVEGAKPVAAGYVLINGLGLVHDVVGYSPSLQLRPNAEADKRFLSALFLGMGTNSFIDYENQYNT